MFGTAKTDTLSAEFRRSLSVCRSIRVGSYAESLIFVGEFHYSSEVSAVGICRNGLYDTVVNVTGRTVERKFAALAERFARKNEILLFFVHLDISATGNTTSTHTSCNDRGVRSLSASDGKDTLSVFHTLDIFGRSFESYKDNFLAGLALSGCFFSGEYHRTCGGSRRSGDTFAYDVVLVGVFKVFSVESGVKKHVERLSVDLHKRFLLRDHALVDKVASDLDCGSSRSLTVSCLKHVKLLVFNGKFHILHVAIVIFKGFANFLELFVNVREDFCHLSDGHRRSYACNDVLALSVRKEFAHKTFFAGSGVTGERNARSAVVAHITERHHLNINGGTPTVRNVVVHSVNVRSRVVPTSEYCLDSLEKLNLGIGRKIRAELFLIFGFELICKSLKVVGVEFNVLRNALLLFHLVDKFFKIFLADFHNDVGEHLNKSSVAVPSPSGVAGLFGKNFDYVLVKTEV